MAVVFDATANRGSGGAGDAGGSFAHVVGDDVRILFGAISIRENSISVSGLPTYAGANTTLFATKDGLGGNPGRLAVYYILDPTEGSNNFSYSLSSGARANVCVTTSWKGASVLDTLGTIVDNNGTDSAATVGVAAVVNQLVIDFLGSWAEDTQAVGANQTLRGEKLDDAGDLSSKTFAGVSTEPGQTSVTMSWTQNSRHSTDNWAIISVPIKPLILGNQALIFS